MGRVDRPKGLLKSSKVSSKVIPFIQDSDYYFQKSSYYHQKNKLSKALLFLKKAIELEPENALHHYNLACLLSKTNRLKEADRIFKHIVLNLDPSLTECYFLMAINYGMMEDLPKAKRYLLQYLQLSPEGQMADEAQELLFAMDEGDEEAVGFCPDLTMRENVALGEARSARSESQFRELFGSDKGFRQALQRALYQGSDSLKERIIRLYGRLHHDEAYACLKNYVINPWVKERLRQVALLELKNMAPLGRCRIFAGGVIKEIDLSSYPLLAPVWREEWQIVLECTYNNMRNNPHYGEEFFADVEAIWLDYINHAYPHVPRIVKPQAWSAGLEYCLARFHFLDVTQKELSRSYGVSAASVGQKYKLINQALHIEQKAYRNMLTFLAHQERERD